MLHCCMSLCTCAVAVGHVGLLVWLNGHKTFLKAAQLQPLLLYNDYESAPTADRADSWQLSDGAFRIIYLDYRALNE